MYLIVPDVHDKTYDLEKILKKYDYIKNRIFLGDFHDSFEFSDAGQIEETARVHASLIDDPNNVVLWGNHDLPYGFPHCKGLQCSGHFEWKQEYIDKWLKLKWDKVKLFHWLEINGKTWLFTHAGLNSYFVNPVKGMTKEYLTELCEITMDRLNYEGVITELLAAGRRRGGRHPVGGLTWADARDFEYIPNINQIFGHTQNYEVRKIVSPDSINFCIDTNLNHIAIVDDDGNIIVEKV